MAEVSGPEKYAPPDRRRAAETRNDVERIAFLRQQQMKADPANHSPVGNLNAMAQPRR